MDTTQTNMSEPQPGPSVTGAQALIESFLREGVDTIFGYPGDRKSTRLNSSHRP